MVWYYSKGGVQLGPVAEAELVGKVRSGEVGAGDLVWHEGMADWMPSGRVPELQVLVSGMSSQVAGMGSVPLPQPPPVAAGFQLTKVPSYMWQAITLLVLCCICCSIFALPCAVVGLVFASKVDRLQQMGDLVGANDASRKAKLWVNIGSGVFLLTLLASVVFNIVTN